MFSKNSSKERIYADSIQNFDNCSPTLFFIYFVNDDNIIVKLGCYKEMTSLKLVLKTNIEYVVMFHCACSCKPSEII